MPVPRTIRGVFLDNAQKHIDEIVGNFPNLRAIKIPDSGNISPLNLPIIPKGIHELRFDQENALKTLIDSLPKPNLYTDVLPAVQVISDAYDILSGIEVDTVETMLEIIDTMVEESSKEPIYALFDWDRTLTRFEGFISIDGIAGYLACPSHNIILSEEDKTQMKKDRLLYLFEGEERLTWVRDIINKLFNKGVIVCIISNNRSCTTPEFGEMVQLLDARIEHIICSARYGGNKATALEAYTFLAIAANAGNAGAASVAPAGGAGSRAYGGRRSRKNKKRNRRTRNRKRR